jgi:RNA polymerase sigma-70 factor (ECF subfamily)
MTAGMMMTAGNAPIALAPDPKSGDRAVDADSRTRFEREVIPLQQILHRHAIRMCRNHSDAEDLVQDTMMKAYKAFHSFQPGTGLKAWLMRIMTNSYINGYRKMRRQPVLCSAEDIGEWQLSTAYQHSAGRDLRSAEEQVLDSLPNSDLRKAMEALAPQFRQVVFYADVEGLRYKEIAAIMNTPTGTVMSRLQRGRRQLRQLLEPWPRTA